MKCKKCQSENLKIIPSGPHNKLVCGDCLAFVKFISNSELKNFVGINKMSIETIKGMLSFAETKAEIGRIGALLATTTDSLAFEMRLESLTALIKLAREYYDKWMA